MADTQTVRITDTAPTMPSALAGTDHPALPSADATGILALVRETMLALGIDAVDAGAPVSAMLASPDLTRAMFSAKRLHEQSQALAARRRLARKLYRCTL